MAKVYTLRRKIEFADTDMAGIVHFSQYTRWMAATEEAFFESLGIPMIEQKGANWRGWPRVRLNCDYKAPLRFPGEVEIELSIEDLSSRSVHFDFKFFNFKEDRKLAAKGQMAIVYVEKNANDDEFASIAMPEEYIQKFKTFLKNSTHTTLES